MKATFLLALSVFAMSRRAPADTILPAGFQESVVFSGLMQPTAVRFARDGRIFVAEKRGIVKVFNNLNDPTPTIFADLRTQVFNFWDRGLLGLALHPDFPDTPYVYVFYALDAPVGGTPPLWGKPGEDSDSCPNPPGATTNGCLASGRISRLEASGNVMTGPEHVLVDGWCQQYPSHSVGTLAFGPDGALYASGGEGAHFLVSDYGQLGSPVNPCGDPPAGVGGAQTVPTARGGALRAQSLRRPPNEPALFSGAVIRIDPLTGNALPDSPLFGNPQPNADRLIAYGMRNPYRMTFRPGTRELWIGDVGEGFWEELNRVPDTLDNVIENFGWPCYEGPAPHIGYSDLQLEMCNSLFSSPGAATYAHFAYRHLQPLFPGDQCNTDNASISGLAFYSGGNYPGVYGNALFIADY
ncbi:MAG: PQQ-dependent sugar dehydrogenase [Deltaproteobacteria bacterium]|nr:PQQ-dependent sugar dehydrogenase [Deltaproteobacteria bacterium]